MSYVEDRRPVTVRELGVRQCDVGAIYAWRSLAAVHLLDIR